MTTSLNTRDTGGVQELFDDDGEVQFTITYKLGLRRSVFRNVFQVQSPKRPAVNTHWLTLEAAQFYALAVYADSMHLERLEGRRHG